MEFAYAGLHEAVAAAHPSREALVWRGRSFTWAELTDRTRRFAGVLAAHGIGRRAEVVDPAPWESAHHHVALYLQNGNPYLEAMVGSWKARAAPVNVNYRYVAEELTHVLADSAAAVVVYQGCFAERLTAVLPRLATAPLLLRVDDGSGDDLLPGALDYEQALAAATPLEPTGLSPDDLYVLYTGGTTGYPKGVLWRQADFLVSALGLVRRDGTDFASVDEVVARAAGGDRVRSLPAPPFMHGAAHWNALSTWLSGGTVIIQDHVDRFDAADVLDTAARHGASTLLIVGDAFARPLVDELARHTYELPHLRHVFSSGAILSSPLKQALLDLVPGLRILDVLGSSESGRQGVRRTSATEAARSANFERDATSVVVSDDHLRILSPGDTELGWLATRGRVPRGYLGDEAKTRRTFPEIDGRRYAVPGDRARVLADGSIELHGRDSVTINSGGEKIFAEEVEHALKNHPDVHDALVVGRPSERWGQEVVAVVAARPGTAPTAEALVAEAAEHVARYKLPKAVVFVDDVPRSPSGKPDYAAARLLAGDEP
jgi:fatty-acyl-CoA synthase